LLGGERGGKRIAGFDLGNSPAEYTRERVAKRSIVFTTTNGTRALNMCIGSSRVLIGAFVNLTAVCRILSSEPRADLVCAGTCGEVSRDDALLAGAIVERLLANGMHEFTPNDQARLTVESWREVTSGGATQATISRALRDTQGGRNLLAIGYASDLELAADIDRFDIVPELDRGHWCIRAT
jgi:2-phosphosulfolactate phosphatase